MMSRAAKAVPVITPLRAAAGTLSAVISATASRGDVAKLRRPRRRGALESGAVAADRKGPRDEPYFALVHLTAWQIRDRRLCRVDVALRDRVFLLRPDARPAGFACLRRLSARHAGHVHRDASLRNAAKQLVRGRVLVACILLFTIGYFRYGGTPGHPALQVFGGFLLGMLSMSIAIRFYGMP
jgi:hypothetical protein